MDHPCRPVALTVRDHLARARQQLQRAGFAPDDAAVDARVLLQHILGCQSAWLFAHGDDIVPVHQDEAIAAAVTRRTRREPVAYIVGEREFYGRAFHVTPAVLIPRPETELIVDGFLAAFPIAARLPAGEAGQGSLSEAAAPDGRTVPARAGIHVADIGTGSGCLAVTLAAEHPAVHVVAVDISKEALAVAEHNARRHGVGDRVRCRLGDLVPADLHDLDAIVSNPPYIATTAASTLPPDVRAFEPHAALFAGEDGLALIRPLLERAASVLRPGGVLAMEIGCRQAEEVVRLATMAGFVECDMRHDLAGIPRTLFARFLTHKPDSAINVSNARDALIPQII